MTGHDRGTGRRDPGRQPERTRLAWRRTMLAATVVVLLAVRLGVPDAGLDPQPGPAGATQLLATSGVLLAWLALLAVSGRRIAAMAAAEPGPAGRTVRLVAVATLGLVGLGLVLVTAG
jgi:uncharacterized membrane protein YidH (DUF202 family)